MVRIAEKHDNVSRRATLKVAENIDVEIEHRGREFVAMHGGKTVSRAEGDFSEWCFEIEKFIVCIDKKEIEVALGVGKDQY